eukprot:TRINITY_DN3850_c0_g1_i1.p1 TRINITY_DN3850_c0_g1~~TRINITY_DN3850_c0_g1_i1.p1  ORF type:complete len:188 (+),score=1.76 TRINITY_DN3850_c0_g1_i1:42-605(+)
MPPVVLYISRLVVDAHGPWLLCEQAGIDYVLEDVDLALGEHRSPAFRAMNPHGTVPALRDGDVCVWEAHAIMRHLCRCYPEAARYYPQQPEALASMEQVLDWRNTSLFRNISAVAGPLLGMTLVGPVCMLPCAAWLVRRKHEHPSPEATPSSCPQASLPPMKAGRQRAALLSHARRTAISQSCSISS